ncbi:hypothetical protein BJF78_27400 [Pseudonocardia sp. CNS-139]|nr:hypothetical protein BJF78_27400 [Pseudonocardia sp. CNS-139]
MNRRRFLGAAGIAALGLAGCAPAVTVPAPAPAAGFPVQVDGAFGPTVVPAAPERVVALGYGPDAATVLGLGVLPVAATRDTSLPDGVPPWVATALAGRPLELLDAADGLPFERIAALRPDLIVATTAYSLAQDHEQLARIAPVLAYTTGPNTDRWQDTTTRVGQVLGHPDEAVQRVHDVEARIAAARAAHPALAGRTFTFGPVTPDGTIYTTNSTADLSAVFLQQLGLVLSPKATALPESRTRGKAVVSPELLDVLDADLLILTFTSSDPALRTRVESDPLFRRLPAVQRGSYVALDLPSALAMAFPSVLSLEYALDQVVGRLADAVR